MALTRISDATRKADSQPMGEVQAIFDEIEAVVAPASVVYDTDYASLSAAVTAIGSAITTLRISSAAFPDGSSCTVPATLTLEFVGAGSLTVASGHNVLILSSGRNWPIRQLFAGSGTVTFTANVLSFQYRFEWFGIVGTADDSVTCQTAAAAFPIGASIKLVPGQSYTTKVLYVKQAQTWDLTGATLVALPTVGDNELFAVGASNPLDLSGTYWTTNTAMSSATQGATSITVTSSAGFAAGDRIVVSAGTYTGSGVEFGPIEFNTVDSIPDGTHIVVKNPLAYNYSGFGLPGAASKKVYKVPATHPRNVKIFGGTIRPGASFNSIYFNAQGVESLEICNVLFDGVGSAISGIGYCSNFNFHDNTLTGTPLNPNVAMDFAALANSRIVNNYFNANVTATGASDANNNIAFEVTCHDNLVMGNEFGPVRGTIDAAVEFTGYCFNNRIIGNRFWGVPSDVTAGTGVRAIRTNAGGAPDSAGNVIIGNRITDIAQGIIDRGDHSIIDGNSLYLSTSHVNSIGISFDSLTANLGTNSIVGYARPTLNLSQTDIPTAQRRFGRSVDFEGNGSPEGVVTAVVGSTYRRLDGSGVTLYYVKGSGSGNTGWVRADTLAGFAYDPTAAGYTFTQGGRSAITNAATTTGLIYLAGAAAKYHGLLFQGQSASDMFFGRAASGDDLIVSTANTASPVEIARFKQGGGLEVADSAYGVGWDGSLKVPTQNAIYDKVEALAATIPGAGANTALSNLASVAINAALVLGTSDAFALGSATKQWSDLFLAEGGVINWDNGDATITQTGNILAIAGAAVTMDSGLTVTGTVKATTAGSGASLITAESTLATSYAEYGFVNDGGSAHRASLYLTGSTYAGGEGAKSFNIYAPDDGLSINFGFNDVGAPRLAINRASSNVKIAGTAVRGTTEGTNHLDIFNGTSPAGTLTNGISIYSRSGECYIMDSAGNETIQSPHDPETNEWIYYSKNTVTGKVLRIEMERLLKALVREFGKKLGEDFIQEYMEPII